MPSIKIGPPTVVASEQQQQEQRAAEHREAEIKENEEREEASGRGPDSVRARPLCVSAESIVGGAFKIIIILRMLS